MPVVRIPTPLRPYAGGNDTVEASGATVGEVLAAVAAQHPDLKDRILDGGDIRRFVNVYVNNEDIRYLDDLATPVADRDEVSIIPAIAGGCYEGSGHRCNEALSDGPAFSEFDSEV